MRALPGAIATGTTTTCGLHFEQWCRPQNVVAFAPAQPLELWLARLLQDAEAGPQSRTQITVITMLTKRTFLVLSLTVVLVASAQSAGDFHLSCAPDGIAVGGFDIVSYSSAEGPTPGLAEFSIELDGLTFLFSSNENRKIFAESPRRFLPEYRGWCAASLAFGSLRCPDFRNFKIEEGRLLLFETTGFTNGRAIWDADPLSNRERADANFRLLVAQ